MAYEYKCVGGPERPKRQKGAKTRSDRVAMAMQQLITEHAVGGWEYLRTDLVPVEEKPGFLSRAQGVHRAVLVFRREVLKLSDYEAGASPARAAREGTPRPSAAEAPLVADPDAAPGGGRRSQTGPS